MPDSSDGDSVRDSVSNLSQSISQSINCHNEECKIMFVPINKRFKYCPNCRDRTKVTPKSGGVKRAANVISPLSYNNRPKHSKGEELAFAFNETFGLDIEDFMVMERENQIEVFRTLICNLRENDSKVDESMSRLREKISDLESELSIARNSHPLLPDMEKELVRVKLALADKDIKLFELTVGGSSRVPIHVPSPSAQLNNVNQSSSIASGPLAPPPIRKPSAIIPVKPFLIARVRDTISVKSITESSVDSLLGLEEDKGGPVVQQLIRHSGNSVKLIFRDEANRDKARDLLDCPEAEKVFQNVHAPVKCYPAILRLNGVSGLSMIREDGSISSADLFNARTKQSCNLINKLNSENPLLKGKIANVRILFNRAEFSLVRVSLLCKDTRDRYLEQGRLKLDNLSHAVIEVDYNKEVRFCNRCQGYGHLARFCTNPVTCGKCSQAHATQTCNVSHPSLKCASCSLNHAAGSYVCAAHKIAVANFVKYNSSNQL